MFCVGVTTGIGIAGLTGFSSFTKSNASYLE